MEQKELEYLIGYEMRQISAYENRVQEDKKSIREAKRRLRNLRAKFKN